LKKTLSSFPCEISIQGGVNPIVWIVDQKWERIGIKKNKDYQKANSRKHTAEYRETLREYLWNYLLTHPGAQCGQADPVVLEFHHIGGKDMDISEMITRVSNVDRLQDELRKTMVLCANCHGRITTEERGWFRSKRGR
jgi:hypothetical protein